MQTMIQIVFRRHRSNGEILERGYEDVAYFPTWKAALVLFSRWNSDAWKYTIREVNEVSYDPDRIHPACWNYRHLWER